MSVVVLEPMLEEDNVGGGIPVGRGGKTELAGDGPMWGLGMYEEDLDGTANEELDGSLG